MWLLLHSGRSTSRSRASCCPRGQRSAEHPSCKACVLPGHCGSGVLIDSPVPMRFVACRGELVLCEAGLGWHRGGIGFDLRLLHMPQTNWLSGSSGCSAIHRWHPLAIP